MFISGGKYFRDVYLVVSLRKLYISFAVIGNQPHDTFGYRAHIAIRGQRHIPPTCVTPESRKRYRIPFMYISTADMTV